MLISHIIHDKVATAKGAFIVSVKRKQFPKKPVCSLCVNTLDC